MPEQRQTKAGSPPGEDPDGALIEAFLGGREDAFDDLVRRHQRRVHRLARRMLGDEDAALDAAQETFVKAWRALPRFEGNARFTTWLTRITINQCRNELRKRGTVKHTRPLSLDETVPGTTTSRAAALPGTGPGAVERLEGSELAAVLEAALATLEPEAREVLVLREAEALSYEEIAELLDVAPGTVRSRLHRSRAALKRALAASGSEAGSPEAASATTTAEVRHERPTSG